MQPPEFAGYRKQDERQVFVEQPVVERLGKHVAEHGSDHGTVERCNRTGDHFAKRLVDGV